MCVQSKAREKNMIISIFNAASVCDCDVGTLAVSVR